MYDWMREYLLGFQMLNKTRRFGEMGMQPICLTEILAYLKLFDAVEPDSFVHHIVEMDQAFLAAQKKKKPAKQPETPPSPERPQRNGRQSARTQRK